MTQPNALTPKLRFPEFRGGPAWESKELHTLADPVSDRADNEDQNNILTLSGEHGLVLQTEYFGKQIAGTNSERYLKIQSDDFVYNDRTTKASAYGTIKRLTKHPHGIVSPIYKCFRFKPGELPVFWEWYFESGAHEAQLRSLANEGARAGRFNVSIDRFLATSVYAPKRDTVEQQKIAECLSTLDELIGAESQKLDALKAHKKGLMQQLFPREGETLPRLRFPEFQSSPEWQTVKLGEVCDIQRGRFSHRPRNDHRFFGGMYPFIQTGDVVRADGGPVRASQSLNAQGLLVSRLFKPTIVLVTIAANIGDTAILDHEACFTDSVVGLIPKRDVSPYFLELAVRRKKEYLNKIAPAAAQKSINNEILKEVEILKPEEAEQHRIATCLTSLDGLIAGQSDRLSALETHKRGLMQQLYPSPVAATT